MALQPIAIRLQRLRCHCDESQSYCSLNNGIVVNRNPIAADHNGIAAPTMPLQRVNYLFVRCLKTEVRYQNTCVSNHWVEHY